VVAARRAAGKDSRRWWTRGKPGIGAGDGPAALVEGAPTALVPRLPSPTPRGVAAAMAPLVCYVNFPLSRSFPLPECPLLPPSNVDKDSSRA